MNTTTKISFALFLVGVGLFLAQIWFSILSAELFLKLLITDGLLFGVSLIYAFLIREKTDSDKINKGSGLQ